MTKVMIAVPTQEMARRATFYDFINMLDKPEGTMMSAAHGQSPARNRNIMIRQALEHGATHILFLDDDVSFKPSLLKDLLAHDKDIVGGLYLHRNFPHLPLIFDEAYEDGKCRYSFLREGREGLCEVVNMGLGCVLIKIEVFKTMAAQHLMKHGNYDEFCWITLGELEKDHWSDDIAFFNRARKAGFKLFIDLETRVGHDLMATIWPERTPDGKWHTAYNTGSSEAFLVPQRIASQEELEKGMIALGLK